MPAPIPEFSAATRRTNLVRLATEKFDLLVIGGGITGAGVAAEAARRGYRVALVEKGDFASGTSSQSSKLVHGGLRYLATKDFRLVYEACRERRELLRLNPDLVWPLPFVLPAYAGEASSWAKIRLGMWLYEGLAAFRNIERHHMWQAREAMQHEPLLNTRGLQGAAHYYDCGTDDARLTLSVITNAHRSGAVVANYVEVSGLLRGSGGIAGAQVRDPLTGAELGARARVVVSAVGPWTDAWLNQAWGRGSRADRWLRPTKGVHIVVPRWRVPSQAALTFTSPRDGRFLFLVPWGEHALLGTTDTDYSGSPDDVYATADDVAYLLEAARHAFPSADLSEGDIVSTYAGLRPLLRDDEPSSYRSSREHCVREAEPGLFVVAGGKLTTYRLMAREAVNAAARRLGPAVRRGGQLLPQQFINGIAAHAPQTQITRTQVHRMMRSEMALTLNDVLARRSHLLNLASDQGLGPVETVADWMAEELGWSPAERAQQIIHYRQAVAHTRRWREGETSWAAALFRMSSRPCWSSTGLPAKAAVPATSNS